MYEEKLHGQKRKGKANMRSWMKKQSFKRSTLPANATIKSTMRNASVNLSPYLLNLLIAEGKIYDRCGLVVRYKT